MLMAAGEGTRLHPLTKVCPKPLLPVANSPIVFHVLRHAARCGIREVAINLHHLPGPIRQACGNGARWGIPITYSEEKRILGTAGGVKKLESFFRGETFFVLSADGLHDIDLQEALRFHRSKKALATMVLKEVDQRFEYGVTLSDCRGRIRGFAEKPMFSQFYSNTVNTGVYLFEPEIFRLIPPRRFYDFGCDVWPSLLKKKKPIYAYLTKNYWCDIGNLSEYRRGQRDALDGKVSIRLPGKAIPGPDRGPGVIRIGEKSSIHPKARLVAPCLIGNHCTVEKEAVLGPYATVGDGSKIRFGAMVKNSILLEHSRIGARAFVADCIVGPRVEVHPGESLYEGILLKDPILYKELKP